MLQDAKSNCGIIEAGERLASKRFDVRQPRLDETAIVASPHEEVAALAPAGAPGVPHNPIGDARRSAAVPHYRHNVIGRHEIDVGVASRIVVNSTPRQI